MMRRTMAMPKRASPASIALFMYGISEVVTINQGLAMSVQGSPFNMARQVVYLLDYDRADAMNYLVAYARAMQVTYALLWDGDILPQRQTGSALLIEAMQNNPQIDLISAAIDYHDHIYTVAEAPLGFMLARTSMFDKLDELVETYDTDGEGTIGGRFFTAGDVAGERYNFVFTDEPLVSDFASLCQRGGVQWWEHGGVRGVQDPALASLQPVTV